jgi:hypothetical protein
MPLRRFALVLPLLLPAGCAVPIPCARPTDYFDPLERREQNREVGPVAGAVVAALGGAILAGQGSCT